ncbi:MAG: hypothetical protein IPF51_16350 [Dehalococcoidia bacterium]|uniref:hypothetical protein n=1 Tax=Candidatus Amarobacter glycogenicus TaxID=3140699 RepID=UPI003134EBAD|nr:hypothetical protein [Dehalococcoidia bacterium]
MSATPRDPWVVAEGRPRGLAEVVHRAVDEVDIVAVEGDAAALEQIEEVGLRAFGDFPADVAGLGIHVTL